VSEEFHAEDCLSLPRRFEHESVEVESHEEIRSGEEFASGLPRANIEEKAARKGDRPATRLRSEHLDVVAPRQQLLAQDRDPDVRAAPF
jgi:hypothetical protein